MIPVHKVGVGNFNTRLTAAVLTVQYGLHFPVNLIKRHRSGVGSFCKIGGKHDCQNENETFHIKWLIGDGVMVTSLRTRRLLKEWNAFYRRSLSE